MAVGVPVLINAALSAGLPGRMDYLQENIKVLDDRVNELHDEIGSTVSWQHGTAQHAYLTSSDWYEGALGRNPPRPQQPAEAG